MTFGSFEQTVETEESSLVIIGYNLNRLRDKLVNLLCIVLIGLPSLLFRWNPTWKLYLTHQVVPLKFATSLLVVETYQKKLKTRYIEKVEYEDLSSPSGEINPIYEAVENENNASKLKGGCVQAHLEDRSVIELTRYTYFTHKNHKFIWNEGRGQFSRLCGIENGVTCASLHLKHEKGTQINRLQVYGTNETVVPRDSIPFLIIQECLNPFYIFQLFSIGVWLAEEYYYYCIAIVIMSTFGVTTTVLQTRRNQSKLQEAVESSTTVEIVNETGDLVQRDSRYVTPGDIVALPSVRTTLTFDAILLNGTCIVDEGMLTGESVPVSKTMLPRTGQLYNPKEHSSHTLYCGTDLIQTRYYPGERVTCLVVRTGYLTSKGQLVRSILYPAPADFKFDRDSYKFIIILTVIAFFGLLYTVILKALRENQTPGDIILKALDIITIVIPPALPAALTVGRLYAVNRLKKQGVFCLNTRAINVSGTIDCFCFDKTGTLTEEGLDMWGLVCAPNTSSDKATNEHVTNTQADSLPDNHLMKQAMATCHSLTLLEGELAGDPLDLKMFESTGWLLEEPDLPEGNKYQLLAPTVVKSDSDLNQVEIGMLRQYQFVSHLQRASVVVKQLHKEGLRVFCKGAPEVIISLSKKETIPDNLMETLSRFAEQGYRVIGAATKNIQIDNVLQLEKMTREEIECDLDYLGLIILENRLKPVTKQVIAELKEANIHVVMITGDNILTAVSVAKECGILKKDERLVSLTLNDAQSEKPIVMAQNSRAGVPLGEKFELKNSVTYQYYRGRSKSDSDEIEKGRDCSAADYRVAMSGDVWKVLRDRYEGEIPRLIERGAVFARMTSDQKQQLVQEYQALGYYVGMCGDGANDCGALRTAHAGLALSSNTSSVAAPFASSKSDISCAPFLLKQGRSALSTAFGLFKFMISYSMTQFTSVAILFYFESNLTDFQFLFIDLGLSVSFALCFGEAGAAKNLHKKPPLSSLLSFGPIISLIFHTLLIGVTQWFSYAAISQFDWFVPHSGEEYACYENYAIFAMSTFQYIILACVYHHGAPYRKSIVTNYKLMACVTIMTVICCYIIFIPAEWVINLMELQMPLSMKVPFIIVTLAVLNFAISMFFERVVVQYTIQDGDKIPQYLRERRVKKTPHLILKRNLNSCDMTNSDVNYKTVSE